MEFLNVFSIMDFLAYLFPGILDTLGIYFLLLLTPLNWKNQLNLDNLVGLLFVILISFIIGVIVSGVTAVFIRRDNESAEGSDRAQEIKGKMHISYGKPEDEKGIEIENEIMDAMSMFLFDGKKKIIKADSNDKDGVKWDKSFYYVCRSAVLEFMPNSAANALRESAYRQTRMNLIGSIAIFMIVAFIWGLVVLASLTNPVVIEYVVRLKSVKVEYREFIGPILIILSIAMWALILNLKNRMDRNEEREVREILTAFISGYKNGVFENKEKKTA